MELRTLRHFLAVGEAGGISAAARSLRLTQPALSRQVRLSDSGKLNDTKLPLFRHEELTPGQGAAGPAVVEEEYFTCLVPPGWKFSVNDNHDLVLTRG